METELPKYLPYQKITNPLDRETTVQVTLTHEQMKLLTNLCIEYHNEKGKFGNGTPRHDTLINLFNAHTQPKP